ncbi:hypothetical protein I350_04653 [Cryptococcus amylolentus CBS 6273]|uniref:Uncharacterized protein n=1 Tax=Cryptococcus amylolentus CBS 6273 TaxID=1296118 RepID=A0A1E3JXP1_9TREE|nr:hypothetical protein I350_04653 [Cryptococcus amylolentus CBS 6273]
MPSESALSQAAVRHLLPEPTLSTSSPFHPAYTMSRASTSSQPRSLRQIQEAAGSRRGSAMSIDPWGPLEDEWDESPHFRHGSPGWCFPPRSSTASSVSQQTSALSYGTRMRLSEDVERRNSFGGVEGRRRSSNRSLVGFGFSTSRRRKSSGLHNVYASHRLRSSASSGGYSLKSVDEDRLHQLQRLGLLRRRYSDVVDTRSESEDEDEEPDTSRRSDLREMLSRWSLSSSDHHHYEEDEDDGEAEILTASYASTPAHPFPSFPERSSLSPDPVESPFVDGLGTVPISSYPPPHSPPFPAHLPVPDTSSYTFGGPSSRPSLQRSLTDYAFPPRNTGAPHLPELPSPIRNALSTIAPASRYAVHLHAERLTGSFPVARTAPIGSSPLRETARRQSVMSSEEGGPSQRGSLADAPPLFPRQEDQCVWRPNAPHSIPLPINPYRFPTTSSLAVQAPSQYQFPSLSPSAASFNSATSFESLITPRAAPVTISGVRDGPTTDERLAAEAAGEAELEGYPFHASPIERTSAPASPSILHVRGEAPPLAGGMRRTLSVTFADNIPLGLKGQKRGSWSSVSVYSTTSTSSRRGSSMNEEATANVGQKRSSSPLAKLFKMAGKGKENVERVPTRRGSRKRSGSADAMWEGLGLDSSRGRR